MNFCSILYTSVSLSFSLLSVVEHYDVKNFVFRENWIGSKMAGMKTTFSTFFDPTWTHILAPKAQINNSLNILYYYQFCDFKTD